MNTGILLRRIDTIDCNIGRLRYPDGQRGHTHNRQQ